MIDGVSICSNGHGKAFGLFFFFCYDTKHKSNAIHNIVKSSSIAWVSISYIHIILYCST